MSSWENDLSLYTLVDKTVCHVPYGERVAHTDPGHQEQAYAA